MAHDINWHKIFLFETRHPRILFSEPFFLNNLFTLTLFKARSRGEHLPPKQGNARDVEWIKATLVLLNNRQKYKSSGAVYHKAQQSAFMEKQRRRPRKLTEKFGGFAKHTLVLLRSLASHVSIGPD